MFERSAQAWSASGIPPIEVVLQKDTRATEDGRNQVTLGAPGADCRLKRQEGSSGACLEKAQEAITKLVSTPTIPLAEADIVLDRALLKDRVRLEEVVVHELGHVLGLAHVKESDVRRGSVMISPAPRGLGGPTSKDLSSLRQAYGAICSP